MNRKSSIGTTVLAVLAVLYTLYVARVILIPLAVALLLHLLFSPLVRRLRNWGVPAALTSALVLLALLAGLYGLVNSLSEPAQEWLRDAPTSLRQLSREFDDVKRPLEEVRQLGEEMDQITNLEEDEPGTQQVEIQDPKFLDRVVGGIPVFLTSAAVTFLIAFFLMCSGDEWAQRFVGFGRTWREKAQIIRACRQVQFGVSRHLRTITFINVCLGLAVGLVLYFLDVPNPELWGTMVALFNFAPYVGAIASALVLTVVGITTFGSISEALLVPGVFVVLTSLEGALITPLVLGNRLNLHPLVVFLSVVFWGWMWGITGALIAVPIVFSLQAVLSNLDATRPLAKLMQG